MSEDKKETLETLKGELNFHPTKCNKDTVSLKDDKIFVEFFVHNPEENPEVWILGTRLKSPQLLSKNGWKIVGKDGNGKEGEYIGKLNKNLGNTCHIADYKRIGSGFKLKWMINIKKIMDMFDFEEEDSIDVSFDGEIEYCLDPKKREIKTARLKSNIIEVPVSRD